MPGKSKRKQMRYASSKQSKTVQPQEAVTATTTAGTAVSAKPQTAPVKSGGKAAAAQYTPALLKHVGTELKMSVALSAGILIVIIILAFVLH
jgi:hypothetical protein